MSCGGLGTTYWGYGFGNPLAALSVTYDLYDSMNCGSGYAAVTTCKAKREAVPFNVYRIGFDEALCHQEVPGYTPTDFVVQNAFGNIGIGEWICLQEDRYPSYPDLKCPVAAGKRNDAKAAGVCTMAKGAVSRGNPCDASSGKKVDIQTDYVGPGPFPLRFGHEYNSKKVSQSSFGTNRATEYERSVRVTDVTGLSFVAATRPDSRILGFGLSGGLWHPDADVADKLVRLADGGNNTIGWQYTNASGDEVESYDANGKLLSLSNRAGVTQTLTYSSGTSNDTSVSRYPTGAPACSAIHPDVGSSGVVPAGKLLCVSDFAGRQLNFQYDARGRMVKLLDPAGGQYQ